MKTDRELQLDVQDELRWEPGVKATDIGVNRDQEIVKQLLPGYTLKHRLARASMVKVAVKTKR